MGPADSVSGRSGFHFFKTQWQILQSQQLAAQDYIRFFPPSTCRKQFIALSDDLYGMYNVQYSCCGLYIRTGLPIPVVSMFHIWTKMVKQESFQSGTWRENKTAITLAAFQSAFQLHAPDQLESQPGWKPWSAADLMTPWHVQLPGLPKCHGYHGWRGHTRRSDHLDPSQVATLHGSHSPYLQFLPQIRDSTGREGSRVCVSSVPIVSPSFTLSIAARSSPPRILRRRWRWMIFGGHAELPKAWIVKVNA